MPPSFHQSSRRYARPHRSLALHEITIAIKTDTRSFIYFAYYHYYYKPYYHHNIIITIIIIITTAVTTTVMITNIITLFYQETRQDLRCHLNHIKGQHFSLQPVFEFCHPIEDSVNRTANHDPLYLFRYRPIGQKRVTKCDDLYKK